MVIQWHIWVPLFILETVPGASQWWHRAWKLHGLCWAKWLGITQSLAEASGACPWLPASEEHQGMMASQCCSFSPLLFPQQEHSAQPGCGSQSGAPPTWEGVVSVAVGPTCLLMWDAILLACLEKIGQRGSGLYGAPAVCQAERPSHRLLRVVSLRGVIKISPFRAHETLSLWKF